jgi:hypothetical protein
MQPLNESLQRSNTAISSTSTMQNSNKAYVNLSQFKSLRQLDFFLEQQRNNAAEALVEKLKDLGFEAKVFKKEELKKSFAETLSDRPF